MKQVDFAKEKVVVSVWAGSGQDRLKIVLVKSPDKTRAYYFYQAGATDDFRRHAAAYAIPKSATVEVQKKRD